MASRTSGPWSAVITTQGRSGIRPARRSRSIRPVWPPSRWKSSSSRSGTPASATRAAASSPSRAASTSQPQPPSSACMPRSTSGSLSTTSTRLRGGSGVASGIATASAGTGVARGTSMENTVPRPGHERSFSGSPSRRATRSAIARPMPRPCPPLSRRRNSSKISFWSPSAMPGPVSQTSTARVSPRRRQPIRMRPRAV